MADTDQDGTPPVGDQVTTTPSITPEDFERLTAIIEAQSAQIDSLVAASTPAIVENQPDPSTDPENQQPENWKAVRSEMDERAARVTRAEIEKIDRERKEAVEAEQARRSQLDKQFDEQLDKAQELGFLVPVSDINDPKDPGVIERKELFNIAAKLGTPNLVEVAELMKNNHQRGLFYDIPTGKYVDRNAPRPLSDEVSGFSSSDAPDNSNGYTPTPGAIQRSVPNNRAPEQAPVGSSSGRSSSGTPTKIPYEEFQRLSMDRLIAKYGR